MTQQVPPRSLLITFALFILVIVGASCKKESIAPVEEEPVDHGMFYKLIRVENFQGDTTNSDHTTAKKTLYYSLEQNAAVEDAYQKTRKWDVAFGSLYASFLSGNNGKDATNYGAGTSAAGGILILEKKFSEVTDVPADSEFKTGKDLYGTDNAGDFGVGTGWYLYDFGGVKVRNGGYDNEHIAYALAEPLTLIDGTTVPARTLVVRTANGNYAKIRMVSVYKNAFTPVEWFRNTPHMYFTFEYVMIPKGSTKFEIK